MEVVGLVSSDDESGSVSFGESVYWKEWSDVRAGSSLVLEPTLDKDHLEVLMPCTLSKSCRGALGWVDIRC